MLLGKICLLLLPMCATGLASQGQVPTKPAATTTATATGRAVVWAVSSADHQRFILPQVRLADASAAARINRELVAIFDENLEASAARHTAAQAVKHALASYRDLENQGFTNASYEVLYNGHSLLSLAFYYEFLGAYPSTATRHATFDLRTGRLVAVRQLLADTVALRRSWQQAISREVAAAIHDLPAHFPELDSSERADFQQQVGWNPARKSVDFGPGQPRFDDFALTATGLTLYYDFGFPHVSQALEPEEVYPFPYATLRAWIRPGGLLGFRK